MFDRRRIATALRTTAARLREGAPYQWGHAGSCNCGHLAQTITRETKDKIYRHVAGEWSEYLREYCPHTGQPLDEIALRMIEFGFRTDELAALENLSDKRVLRALPGGHRHLQRNRRDDVVLYLETWANLLAVG
ncbi:MAG: hypothetical protein B7733_02565 [Myxococcales bacterium FL481]|nr:MAG: hypothetical protein B7733_02565 [Myxococcales bacterium FL481]